MTGTAIVRRRDGSPDLPRSELVEAFLAGRNEHTLGAYRQDLEDFRAFVGAFDLDAAARTLLSLPHGEANGLVLAYRAELVDRGLAAATINRRLAALRSLVKLGRTLGLVSWALEVPSLEARAYRDTRGPGRDGYLRLLAALKDRQDAKGTRDRAILRLLYDLALRRAEVCRLDVEDVDLERGAVAVLGKKRTGKEPLTLPAPTAAALETWLEERGPEPGPLFVNLSRAHEPGRITPQSLTRLVKRLGREAGLKVTPHGLRHAAITDALDLSNGNLRAVQRFSRHRDPRVLCVYDDNREDLGGQVAALVAEAAA